MIVIKQWHFLMLINVKIACCLYFTMSNMEGTIPIVNKTSVTGRIFSIHAAGSKPFTYSMKITDETSTNLLNIDQKTGDLYYSTADNVRNISAEVIAQDDLNHISSSYFSITTTLVETCNEKILKHFCFWSKITYQIKRASISTYLGTLAPSSIFSGCPMKNISYEILTGTDYLKLHPPDNNTAFWMLGTSEESKNFTKSVYDSKLYSNISCTVRTSDIIVTFTKQVQVNLLENDFSPPEPQEQNIKIRLNGSRIRKGHVIDQNIIFLDQHSIHDSMYQAFIDDKNVSDFLSPNCTFLVDSRDQKNRTAIHCKLLVTKSRIFKEDSIFLLALRSSGMIHYRNSSTGYINITLSVGNNHNKRSFTYFKYDNKIFRTAAPYARVTQPYSHKRNILDYSITAINFNKNPFQITNEGIVYVYDFLTLRDSPEHLRLNITWSQNNITQYEEISVRAIDEPNKTCLSISNSEDWTFCSQFKNQKGCIRKDSCALGTGGSTSVETRSRPQRCMWRGDKNPDNHETHMYSTCSADLKYCPDGICDSLEILREDELCPQDCSKKSTFPTKLNAKTGQGVDKCNGVLICDMVCFCDLRNTFDASSIAQIPKNKLIVDDRKCDLKCIVGIVGGILILIGTIFSIFLFWRINHVKKVTEESEEKYMHNLQELDSPFSNNIERNRLTQPLVLNFNMTTFDNANVNLNNLRMNEIDTKWEFPRNQICIEQILGEGEFGKVLKAKAFNIAGRPGYSLIAVKTLKDDAKKQDYNDLFSEYQLLKEVDHPHVIQLLGVCSSDDGPLYVIIEYAEFGSLRNHLRKNRHISTNTELASSNENFLHKVTTRDISSFARQISSGMAYLSDIKLVHRDLAARNILLAENKKCKISDFGLTRDIYEENAYFKKSKGRVPIKWMAPESLADHVYTTKSDVWSFGILIWELVTLGANPYPGVPVHNLYNLLKDGYRMEKPTNCSAVLYSVMNRCWNIDPEERPSFSDLYHCFDNLLTDNYLDLSDNSIGNMTYFSMGTETGTSSTLMGTNMNLLENYPLHKESLRSKDIVYDNNIQENKNGLGYETPVKNPRRTTPTNEMPEEYVDMNLKEEM